MLVKHVMGLGYQRQRQEMLDSMACIKDVLPVIFWNIGSFSVLWGAWFFLKSNVTFFETWE